MILDDLYYCSLTKDKNLSIIDMEFNISKYVLYIE